MTRVANIRNGEIIFDYNAMGNKILDTIEEVTDGCRYPLFNWLSDTEKSEAIKHFNSIESVPG